jgi:hypothetical protein
LLALNRDGAGNPDNCAEDVPSAIDSGGHNLVAPADIGCSEFNQPSDRTAANPKIGKLAKNGGPTKTIALKKGSPAINKAGNDAPGKDQRGVKHFKRRDIGAFEFRP